MAAQQNTANDNKATARRLINELWNNKNPKIIQELVAPNVQYHAGDQELHGRKDYRAFYDTYVKAFPHLSIQISELVAEGDRVAVSYTARGQHTGALRDIKPTGRQVNVKGLTMMRFKDGALVESTNVWDALRLMEQLGLVSETLTGRKPA